MAVSICPTVTAKDGAEYQTQMENIARFATRVHIDIADGLFAPIELGPIDGIWWPGGMRADIHVMYQRPFDHTQLYLSLQPQMVVVHAEAEGQFVPFAELLHEHGIEVGVALLPQTPVQAIKPALPWIDHVLIFSGDLGHFGGHVDLSLLGKAHELRALKPTIEIGWDGGISDQNALQLAQGGIDVLNTGGFIQRAPDSQAAYELLQHIVQQ
jgi:ribulose-phosphate 3-epimerase